MSQIGFPYFQLDRFLKLLVQDLKKHVAISEEFANDAAGQVKSGGLLFDRRVTRVITPGTLIDEKFLDPWDNNFLLSIHLQKPQVKDDGIDRMTATVVGLAWLDLSSGDFFTQKTDIQLLPSVISRIRPREILAHRDLQTWGQLVQAPWASREQHDITFHAMDIDDSTSKWSSVLEDESKSVDVAKFSQAEIAAVNYILQYVDTKLQGNLMHLRTPMQRETDEFMMIDKHSLRALEVRTTLRDGNYEGSLLHAIRRTVTKSGTRLLSQRLSKSRTPDSTLFSNNPSIAIHIY